MIKSKNSEKGHKIQNTIFYKLPLSIYYYSYWNIYKGKVMNTVYMKKSFQVV